MAEAWTEAAIADLTGVTAVVTGASGGIGLEAARGLAAKGAHVVLAVRSAGRGQSAASAIRQASSFASVEVMALDLADLASVRRFAGDFGSRSGTLGLLINNAGVASPSLQRTADGFELDFGTNHLGHFALTGLLLPIILCSPKARVITVTSMAHRRGRIDFANLDGRGATRQPGPTPRASSPTCCSPTSCSAACPRREPASSALPATPAGRPPA